MAYTTVDNVTLFLNKSSLSTTETSLVNLLITMLSGAINNYCGWELAAKDYEVTFDGNGTNSLDVRVYPVNELTSLTIDDVDYTADVSLNSPDGELFFTTESGIIFTAGKQNVVVEFNGGYSATPDDLAYAASWLVALNFNRITQEAIGVSEDTFNNVKVKYDPSDIPKIVKDVLDRYRRISVY